MPSHTDEKGSIVTIVSRPKVLGILQNRFDIRFDIVPVDLLDGVVIFLLDFGGRQGRKWIWRLMVQEGTTAHVSQDVHACAVAR